MKKSIVYIILIMIMLTSSLCVCAQQRIILQGGIQQNVPVTPSEVGAYLIQMKAIMKEYEALSNQLIGVLNIGVANKGASNYGIDEWIRLANKIDSLPPPKELTTSHKQLASSLRRSSQFLYSLKSGGNNQQQVLMGLMPVVSDLSQAGMQYQQGVDIVINRMRLNPSLNPLGQSSGLTSSQGGINMQSLKSIMSGLNLNNLNSGSNLGY